MRVPLLAALPLTLLLLAGVRAQSNDILAQQATLQSLLNNATVALRNNDSLTACQLQSQALGILNNNFNAFVAAFPTNNWSDLQTSLQISVGKCEAKGR